MNCNFNEILRSIFVFLPAISSLTCGIIFFIAYQYKLTHKENLIRRFLLFYFIIITLWFPIGLSKSYDSLLYVYPLVPLGAHISQVLFYHFISVLTNEEDDHFFSYHYYIPLLLFVASSFIFYTSLYDESLSSKDLFKYMRIYSIISSSLYMIFYLLISIRKIILYRSLLDQKEIGNSKTYVNWLYWVIGLRGIIIIEIFILFIWNSSYMLLFNILISLQQIIIVYNILQKNYRFLYKREDYKILVSSGQVLAIRAEPTPFHEDENPVIHDNLYHNTIIDQKEFENYFATQKPYLDPELKITDLTKTFNTNRAYLSRFVNEIYGMNFKQYLNQWRIKEVDHLLQMEENKNKDTEGLVKQAGFGSIRTYWRAKKM